MSQTNKMSSIKIYTLVILAFLIFVFLLAAKRDRWNPRPSSSDNHGDILSSGGLDPVEQVSSLDAPHFDHNRSNFFHPRDALKTVVPDAKIRNKVRNALGDPYVPSIPDYVEFPLTEVDGAFDVLTGTISMPGYPSQHFSDRDNYYFLEYSFLDHDVRPFQSGFAVARLDGKIRSWFLGSVDK